MSEQPEQGREKAADDAQQGGRGSDEHVRTDGEISVDDDLGRGDDDR